MRFLSLKLQATIAMLLAIGVSAQVASSPPPSYQFASGGSSLDIAADVVADGLVFLQAKINGHAGWFILDNATQGFTIDADYARRISLQANDSALARGGGANAIDAGIVRKVEIGLPGLTLTHRNLVVIPLKALESTVGHTVDGIIGSGLFDDFVVVVHYDRRSVSIYHPQSYGPSAEQHAFPVQVDQHGFPFLSAKLVLAGASTITGTFLVDGGANTYADLYKPFSDAHQIPPPAMKLLDEPGQSTGGTTASRDGRAERILLGPYSIQDPPITFAQDTEGLLAAQGYAGLLGAKLLQRFTVAFDLPRKRILLTPNRTYEDATLYDESGLRIRAEGRGFHTFLVTRIVPASPATEAGIKPGDRIQSINQRAAERMTLTEVRTMLRQPNARCELSILRGSTHLHVTIALRPLL